MTWTDEAESFLLDATMCPRCLTHTWLDEPALVGGICQRCGADLSGEEGAELWAASSAVVEAVRQRAALVARLPIVARTSAASTVSRMPSAPRSLVADPAELSAGSEGAPAQAPSPAGSATRAAPKSTVSVQSVLAVAGAGLLAVAAIVFTFLNPDLTDDATRATILLLMTAVFLGGAFALFRRELRFSAEAVGALGMVFLALDIWMLARFTPAGISPWFFGAIGTAVAGGAMVSLGLRLRLRTWLWTGLVGLAVTPAFVGFGVAESSGQAWTPVAWSNVGVVIAGWLLIELARRRAVAFGSALRVEVGTLTVIQIIAALAAVVTALLTPNGHLLPTAVFAAVAATALVTTRVAAPHTWSFAGGLLATSALLALQAQIPLDADTGRFALLGAATAVPLFTLAIVGRLGSIRRTPLLASVLLLASFVLWPAIGSILLGQLKTLDAAWTTGQMTQVTNTEAGTAQAAIVALLLVAAGIWAQTRNSALEHRHVAFAVAARWIAVPATAGFAFASPVMAPTSVGIAITLSVAATLILLSPRVRVSRISLRAPLMVVAYGGLLQAVLVSWPRAELVAIGGVAIVAALALAALTAPPVLRRVHTGVGFAYALVAMGAALSLTDLGLLPILCLVTSAAAAGAIAATLTTRVPVGSWYAVLLVTAVPFLIGVASVVIERSGWTALSTGVIFILAVTLVVTRRPGAGLLLRATAATLLVPTLAVVIVCLTAQLLTTSGSPYALPMIAALVACALPTTDLVRAALVRRGHGEHVARAVRLAIEVSALLTGAIAVVLALIRVAAGFRIAFVVLVILGIGAAATALWLRRRYGWWTAAAAWTGAMWCAWARFGVDLVEPYILPPALAAVIIGSVVVARRRSRAQARPAAGLVSTGLAVAIVPSLVLLAFTGNGDAGTPDALWRTGSLLAASIVLVVLASLATHPAGAVRSRFAPLSGALLVAAVVAGSAGTVQAVRVAWGHDPSPIADAHPMAAAFALSILSAAVAVAAARLSWVAGVRSGWIAAPAFVLVAVGPVAAIDAAPGAIWALWTLELALLVTLVVSVWRHRAGRSALPPVWFQWGLAWIVAVAAWSPREVLRVEGFSLPLGVALILAGWIVLARAPAVPAAHSLATWPSGFSGSRALLGPGIVATLLPSMLATFTSPDTWRAVLVIALALVAVLVGARTALAAPFVLGIAALPLEIAIVFLVQLGTAINPLLWWITLATAGIVLLVIAVGWERRTGADASLAARIRDLR